MNYKYDYERLYYVNGESNMNDNLKEESDNLDQIQRSTTAYLYWDFKHCIDKLRHTFGPDYPSLRPLSIPKPRRWCDLS